MKELLLEAELLQCSMEGDFARKKSLKYADLKRLEYPSFWLQD